MRTPELQVRDLVVQSTIDDDEMIVYVGKCDLLATCLRLKTAGD